MHSPEIRVGIDGSPSSAAAVRWAAAEAARRNVELVIVHAYDWRVGGARMQVGGAYADAERELAETLVESAAQEARAFAPGLKARGEAFLGAPGPALVNPSGDVALTVVGSRGRGGFASLLLGSVSQRVATHASGPVVVVRGRTDATEGPIVVGVDGSPAADYALHLALEEAAARRTGVIAVRVYPAPNQYWAPEVPAEDPVRRREHEQRFLAEDIAAWLEKYPAVPVEPVVLEGHPAGVLADLSASAQLIVVGTRGHGGFTGLLLGSVGLQVLHHAQCPVLIAHQSPTIR